MFTTIRTTALFACRKESKTSANSNKTKNGKNKIKRTTAVRIGEEDCFNFCHQLLNKWGVGKKDKNNGLVILLVTDQRCIQFYTGYGLEGVLPDAICKRIQTRYMIPYLKDGNWDTTALPLLCN